jgi:hypothetical protein
MKTVLPALALALAACSFSIDPTHITIAPTEQTPLIIEDLEYALGLPMKPSADLDPGQPRDRD